jgi:hypothetical protein
MSLYFGELLRLANNYYLSRSRSIPLIVKKFERSETILTETWQANRYFVKLLPSWPFGSCDLEIVPPAISATYKFGNCCAIKPSCSRVMMPGNGAEYVAVAAMVWCRNNNNANHFHILPAQNRCANFFNFIVSL